ncbi:MAG: hypothetical protein C7B46_20285 [Sulfobacillus benefaciens]|uniref:Uncharacterized protein n=1 Tax=Sulfobacillus benefaciens TaxID=453960 RepID=A0A2T2WV07_9FIRM|nr:MAG: hypothetical protein C7B46_20285 [Sulfobacillus benefaciens]
MNPSKRNVLDLSKALESLLVTRYPVQLPSEYRYAHLSLALIDAIYSLGAKYESTRATVLRYAQNAGLKPFRVSVDEWPAVSDQQPLSDLLTMHRQRGLENMLSDVYQNRQRTSAHASSITKAEAVFQAAEVLEAHHVNVFQDIPGIMGNPSFEADFRTVRGQGPGTGLSYFWMLTGSEDHIKADRMVIRYLEATTGLRRLSGDDAKRLMEAAAALLCPRFPTLTLRQMDYIIWEYQRSVDAQR